MLTYIKKIIGTDQDRKIKKYSKIVEKINKLEPEFEKLSDEQLISKTNYLKEELANGKSLEDIKVEAFAVVREASKRVLGMRHYDVQLIGGLVLLEGNISEMATGEGKTLVASLPSYLRALEGKGVHVITVNDYLARRDREIIGQIHEFLGLKVGLNLPGLGTTEKQEAYNADITYGVGTEFGFDYLRDNMVYDERQKVQRTYHYAIIDEIDSVLIDEAKTPLIIAGKTTVSPDLYYICAKLTKRFKVDVDYIYDAELKSVNFTDDGITKVERAFGIDNLYDLDHQTLYHFTLQALRARVMFQKDVEYIVSEGEIKLVDMFTGRIMDGRSYSDGLHQAIEAKEGLVITEENKTQALVTIQNYFRMYPILSGMTGTAKTEEKEFQMLYSMDVIQIPTNKQRIRVDLEDQVYQTKEQKYQAVALKVKELHEKGQPVLVGTTSIIQSETVANYIDELQLPYELLNAKSVEKEVQLISLAGQKGQITIATNMAGRGTDIMLGDGAEELGGLFVLGTERHESRRIDNQLKGRSGRQGDPGTTQFFICLEDEMMQRFAREDVNEWKKVLKADDTGLVLNKEIHEFIDKVQHICESGNYSAREYTLKLDDIVNEQRNTIYRLRNKAINDDNSITLVLPLVKSATQNLVAKYCPEEQLTEEWNISELKVQLKHVLYTEVDLFSTKISELEEVEKEVADVLNSYITLIEENSEIQEFQLKCKQFLLMALDFHWLQHIEEMTRLKEGIGLRSYQQEDPMRVYEREGFELFTKMYQNIERDTSIQLARIIKHNQNEV
ncbi:accessory Sec system translocase SecA2 [Anaerobacillus isosaccharinicus]|uniref:Protein translocase subunit SecA n=1 Tax=Anaerobacillus isosaccharinicus TaxID=1532552 RepID=A0A1S2M8A8_9BACI|nr:accessory Sec system translocase SecA2 [Anaerobacillus isosaccharinicus]MBA5584522.1 accessory Sec system translocase SecA2 [Anaerobacillus isosaccharinicus]QOY37094.1 accessory Sec system translocase SecA2 [Anaerobacillus isosaccharinicus]